MDRIEKQPPHSFGMFSGTTDISATSIASATTVTVTPITSPSDKPFYQPKPIKIVKYVCPNPDCGWECQKKE